MKFLILPIFSLFFLVVLFIGFILITKPELAIEIQRRFYAKINWKIEPISIKKELRNTRIMGAFAIILTIVTLIIIVLTQ